MSSVERPKKVIKGQLYEKVMSIFELKIPVYFYLMGNFWFYRNSYFPFFDKTWEFLIFTRHRHMHLSVQKKYGMVSEDFHYKLSILETDGMEYASVEGTVCKKTSPITFTSNSIILSEDDLLLSGIVQDGALTVSCIITHHRYANVSEETEMSPECKAQVADKKEKDSEAIQKEDDNEEDILAGLNELSQDFKDLLITGEDSDITMKVKDREFKVHKIVLQARSSVFGAMFRNDFMEKNEQVAHITDSDPDIFHRFLLYLYSGKAEKLSSDEVPDMYRLADKYDVKLLKAQCLKFMIRNMSVDNFCDFMDLALLHEESALIEKATNIFSKEVREIIVNVKWISFQKEHPIAANELQIKAWNINCPR